MMETCVICFDDFSGRDDGVKCCGSAPHFVCNECFIGSVRSLMTDDLSVQDLRNGRVACPLKTFPHTTGSCDAPSFDDRIVATKVDAPTFDDYLQVRSKLIEAKLARDADVETERKVSAAVRAMQKEGVEVFETQKHIVDDILTMRCPRCKMAFADWDGCNAVYCTYAGCGCNFCPFCLKDCGGGVKFGQREIVRSGDDAVHRHIQTCEHARGIGIGVNDGRIQRDVWNRLRKQRIEKCLNDKCSSVEQRQKVLDNLKTHLDELGLVIRVPQGEASSKPVPRASKRLCRARCRYGMECYRKHPEHRQTYAHPGVADWEQTHDTTARSTRSGA
jgi:hypothetical protein